MKFNGESDGPLFPVVQPKPKKRHFLDHMVPNFLYSNSYQFFNIIVIIMIINIIITLIIIMIIIIIIFLLPTAIVFGLFLWRTAKYY